jgi:hypothetical protein
MGGKRGQGLTQDQPNNLGPSPSANGGDPLRLLSREDILGVTDMRYENVHVPEWGGAVRVRGLRAAERDEYEASMVQQRGKDVNVNIKNIRARLVTLTCVNDKGERLFTEADVALLGQKSAAALERVYEVAARLSTIDESAVEALAGNSASDRLGASSSA